MSMMVIANSITFIYVCVQTHFAMQWQEEQVRQKWDHEPILSQYFYCYEFYFIFILCMHFSRLLLLWIFVTCKQARGMAVVCMFLFLLKLLQSLLSFSLPPFHTIPPLTLPLFLSLSLSVRLLVLPDLKSRILQYRKTRPVSRPHLP